MATFAQSHSSLDDDFVRDGSLGGLSGREGDRSDTMSFELLTDISPQTQPFMDFNHSEGAPSEQNFALFPSEFEFAIQMSQGYGQDGIFQQNHQHMTGNEQYMPGSSASFEQSNVMLTMPFGQQTHGYSSPHDQAGKYIT